jgi:hypothetical protein
MTTSLPTFEVHRASRLSCFQLDPTKDVRWSALVEKHPSASVFHTVGWLQALRRTYGYEPVVFTTSSPAGELRNGLVLCRIRSWLTGRRLVSLPFSDHCQPLCNSAEDLDFLMRYLRTVIEHQDWRYLEVRPTDWNFDLSKDTIRFSPTARHFLHILDLTPDINELFRKLDKHSVQQKIRRAERAGLVETCGRSEDLLKDFYGLFVLTRRRHRLPPTPYAWFRNLAKCQDKALEVRVACKDKTPVSAILTLRFRDILYYKYSGSDARFNNLGATPWLLWRAIAAAKLSGATKFDMGRTEEENAGLLAFKNHWVSEPKRLIYWRFPENASPDPSSGWKLRVAKRVFSCMPSRILTIAGRLLYRHIA